MTLGKIHVASLLAAVAASASATGASAQVRDAVYRGTLVCDKLPFFETAAREAIEVRIKAGAVSYIHVVRERAETSFEQGTGTLDGDRIALTGAWSGEANNYDASYSGTFVRRSAQLTGTQTWQNAGKTHVRKCSGAVKRPLAAFLPKDDKGDRR
jgi:hypothetical protein